ncbi:hypothetical protein OAM67_00870 [bacterium]|nr:hypothetical protein [bacterium]
MALAWIQDKCADCLECVDQLTSCLKWKPPTCTLADIVEDVEVYTVADTTHHEPKIVWWTIPVGSESDDDDSPPYLETMPPAISINSIKFD